VLCALDGEQYKNLSFKHAIVADCYLKTVLDAVHDRQNVPGTDKLWEKAAKRRKIDLEEFLVQHIVMHVPAPSAASSAPMQPPSTASVWSKPSSEWLRTAEASLMNR